MPVQNEINNNLPVRENNSDEDILYRVSHLGFQICVNVKCPLAYAPLQFVKQLDSNKFQTTKRPNKSKEMTNIKMTFECFGATYPRLPTFYRYNFCPSEF